MNKGRLLTIEPRLAISSKLTNGKAFGFISKDVFVCIVVCLPIEAIHRFLNIHGTLRPYKAAGVLLIRKEYPKYSYAEKLNCLQKPCT